VKVKCYKLTYDIMYYMQRFNVCQKADKSDIEIKKDSYKLQYDKKSATAEKSRAILRQSSTPAGVPVFNAVFISNL